MLCQRGRHGRRPCDGVSLPRRTPVIGFARFLVRRPWGRVICLCQFGKAPSAVLGSRLPARCLARTSDAPRTRSPIACAPSMPCKVSGAGTHRACARGRGVRVPQVGDVECRPDGWDRRRGGRLTLYGLHRVAVIVMRACIAMLTTSSDATLHEQWTRASFPSKRDGAYCAVILLRSRADVPRRGRTATRFDESLKTTARTVTGKDGAHAMGLRVRGASDVRARHGAGKRRPQTALGAFQDWQRQITRPHGRRATNLAHPITGVRRGSDTPSRGRRPCHTHPSKVVFRDSSKLLSAHPGLSRFARKEGAAEDRVCRIIPPRDAP